MFGTVLWDVYRKSDIRALKAAIDDLASAQDRYGWSSTGVYAFYDPTSRSIGKPHEKSLLYLGLATDLPVRFAEHNGIISTRPSSSKWQKIQEWFESNEMLGYAAFAQSPLNQAHNSRFRKSINESVFLNWTDDFDSDVDARRSIELLEGQLIETAVIDKGAPPVWNKIGGSVQGQTHAAGGTGAALIKLLTGSIDNLFVARRSIRELSGDLESCAFETDLLHPARMQALFGAWDSPASSSEIRARLEQNGLPSSSLYDSHNADALVRMLACGYLTSSTRGRPPVVTQKAVNRLFTIEGVEPGRRVERR